MKQRLLVMNGQRLVQSEQGGQWQTDRVEKAGATKPGIYNIYLATAPDKSKRHDGPIVYIDKSNVFQQVGKAFVKHALSAFVKAPEVGANSSIAYVDGKAQVSASTNKLGRKI